MTRCPLVIPNCQLPPEVPAAEAAEAPAGAIAGFYHLATIGDYRRVLAHQLAAIEASGLAAAGTLHVRVSGDGPVPELPPWCVATRNAAPLGLGEVPTLLALQAFARANPGARLYYLHSKGVSYRPDDPKKPNVELWREYLEHFVIGRWREALEALDSHDLHGPEWTEPGPAYRESWGRGKHDCPGEGHFAGNFWWARADYVASLPDRPMRGRFDAEWHFLTRDARRKPRVSCPHKAAADLYRTPYPRARYEAPGGPVARWSVVSSSRLAEDALGLSRRLPADVDAVCAIARSGLMPGGLIAAARHLPLYTASRHAGILDPGHGLRMEDGSRPVGEPRHVLLIDDTVGSGAEMAACSRIVAERWPGAKVTRAAVYAWPVALQAGRVDLVGRPYEGMHFLEWNWPNSHGLNAAWDFDGVLCEDCPAGDDDDGPRYRAFLDSARPLFLARRKAIPLIVTARHEKYRAESLAWLDRHGVRCDRLVMRDWGYGPDPAAQIADWKARHFLASRLPLFVESDADLARRINATSGKAVLCPELGRVLPPRPGRLLADVVKCPDRVQAGNGCSACKVCNRTGRRVDVDECLACVATLQLATTESSP